MEERADAAARLRLLECWLPLARALAEELGWAAGPPELERLVERAAAGLAAARSADEARAILALYQGTPDGG